MNQLEAKLKQIVSEVDFSGTILVQKDGRPIYQSANGYANRSEERVNTINTRYGIASGCKLFTAIGIAILVDEGKLTFETKLTDCLGVLFPHFSKEITLHHLLCHTSGIPDYFDESVMDDFAELWETMPMYKMDTYSLFSIRITYCRA